MAESIAMIGGGFYNANCTLQRMAIEKSLAMFQPASLKGKSVVLADYGSSEGHNAIWLLQRYLELLASVKSATLVFNDTPSNDFSSLSLTISEHWTQLSQNGNLMIHPLMVPRSYFQQVLPEEFVDAAFSFTALHWLQHRPPVLDDDAKPYDLSLAANNDLVDFLSARHCELRAGGSLTLCIPAHGDVSVAPALKCLQAVVRELSQVYRISPSVVTRIPLYFRTMDEILSAVSASQGDWKIIGNSMVPIEHPACLQTLDDTICPTTGASSYEAYASASTGFNMAALSGFLVEDVRQNMGNDYPGDVIFLKTLHLAFEREFLRSHIQEKVGFTYAFLHLQKA